MALAERKPRPGLVHHSGRGVQKASQDYTELLQQHQIQIIIKREDNSVGQGRLRIVLDDIGI
jgi:transposase InsO family protein